MDTVAQNSSHMPHRKMNRNMWRSLRVRVRRGSSARGQRRKGIGKSQNTKGNARPRRKRGQRKATLSLNASALTRAMASATQGNARQPEGNATVASKEDLNQGRKAERKATHARQPIPIPNIGTGAWFCVTTDRYRCRHRPVPVPVDDPLSARSVVVYISIPSITDVLERISPIALM